MPYTLIPDGFELKKVTKLQKDAVDEHFGRERIGSYLDNFLGNSNTPIVIGGFIATWLALRKGQETVDTLLNEGFDLSHDLQQGIKDAALVTSKELVTDPINWLVTNLQLTGASLSKLEIPGLPKL